MNFLCFINLATSLAYFLLEQVDARGVVSMEISRSAPVGGANMAQAYDTDRQNIPSKEIAGPSTENIYDSPWFPECSVCDELLPPPERDSANAGNQNDQWPSQPKLRAAPRGEECCKMNGTEADCRHCSLTTIPNSLPPEITHLLMGHNAITDKSLSRGAFQRYGQLTLLSLSFNLITSLADGIFEGMPSLRCLCLQFNNIKMDNTLNSSLAFQPLAGSLVYLRLNGFNKNTTNINLMYPSYALSFLSKLKYLFIDGIPFAKFENPQRLLTNLTHLGMLGFRSGYCNLTGLQSNAFEFDTLTHLNISDCNLQGSYVNRSAFENLQSLHSLTISNNFQLGIQTVGEMMHGQRKNKNLKMLTMQRINPRFTPCIVVYKTTLRYFKHTGLEIIDATDNEIEIIQRGALQMLPKTLKVLNMKANEIIFGDYIQDLATLTELTDLKLEGSEQPYRFPHMYPNDFLSKCMRKKANVAQISNSEASPSPVHQRSYIKSIPIPPKLFKIYMRGNGMAYTLDDITFSTPNALVSADLSRNVFKKLLGPIRGLDNLSILQMDNCDIQFISNEFFSFFPSLSHLSLFQNHLGKSLSNDTNGDVFKNLKNLTLLVLSENNIYRLYPPSFKNMAKIKHLDLTQNRLGKVEFFISHMKSLITLNLKGNEIQRLSRETMAEFDEISKGRDRPLINLSFNPISCDCDSLDFLEWLTDTGQVNRSYPGDYYFCNMIIQPNGYGEVIQKLRRECIKHDTLFVVVVSATMVVMVAIAIVLAYRFR